MIERLLLEEELRRSGILNDHDQVGEIADIVMNLVKRGLVGADSMGAAKPNFREMSRLPADGKPVYCRPRYNGDATQPIFLVKFEDAEVHDQTFHKEVEARAFFQAAIESWNCYLFGLLER
jgi:hypothetical protein